jgi:hypothetical protein
MKPGKPRQFRLLILLLVLLVCVAIYFSGVMRPGQVKVEIKKKEVIKSNYSFIYEHWQEDKLKQLRENEDFTAITASDQFQYFLKLCDWVHRQWERSVPDPYPLSNAIDILRDIRSKKTGGFCGQYAYVLADVLKSLGFFNVRYVELWSNKEKNKSHFVVEVWSDLYGKWVILDPDYNIYYEVKESGIPANAYEIRHSLFGGPKVIPRSVPDSQEIKKDEFSHLYANFAVSLRSDLMRHPKPLTVGDRFRMFLFFKDENTNEFFFGNSIPYIHVTQRKEDLYYDCNVVRVEYTIDKDEGDVILSFFTDASMPNFKAFSISSDRGKTWKLLRGNQYRVKKSRQAVVVLAAPVNMYDRPGCINTISIEF